MRVIGVKQLQVKKLLRAIEDGRFAVPRLQREFVWNGKKAAALLDSIYRSMPIGSIVVWQTRAKNQYLLRQHLHILPAFHDSNSKIWFLIDGQQRLSVLHHAAKGSMRNNGNGQAIDFNRITFRLHAATDDSPIFSYRHAQEREFVSTCQLLDSRWRSKLAGIGTQKLARAEACRSLLLDYKVPLIVVEGEREEVRELFIRINSTGTPLASADKAFAFASRMDFRDKAHQIRDKLPQQFRSLPFETILQAFAFVAEGGPLNTATAVEVGERAYEAAIRRWEKQITKDSAAIQRLTGLLKRLSDAVHDAVTYLTRFGVLDATFLPSSNMVATLAVFFFHYKKQPSANQRREIQRWFWATGVGQRYSGRGFRQNIQKDVKFFERLARGAGRFPVSELLHRNDVLRCDYSRRSSLTNAFYCLLALQGPRYATNGEPLPEHSYATAANRKDRHHIFPKQLCNNYGIGHQEYNSICNICFLITKENKSFSANQPRKYLEEFKSKKHFRSVMNSHLIPSDKLSGLWMTDVKKAFRTFVHHRRESLCAAFEKRAGSKLFRPN